MPNALRRTEQIQGPPGPKGDPGDATAYTPTTPANWNGTPPTTIQAALDRLAAWIAAHGGGPLP